MDNVKFENPSNIFLSTTIDKFAIVISHIDSYFGLEFG
jgi:hypothetical protein